jgi:hypothetical protein
VRLSRYEEGWTPMNQIRTLSPVARSYRRRLRAVALLLEELETLGATDLADKFGDEFVEHELAELEAEIRRNIRHKSPRRKAARVEGSRAWLLD